MAVQGYVGGAGSVLTFGTPVSINCTLDANNYPEGTLTFDNISDGNAYWKNNGGYARSINLYLCDSAGNNRVFLFTVSLNPNGSNTTIRQANISGATGLMGKALYLVSTGDTEVVQLRRYTTITINTAVGTHDIYGLGATGGSFSLSKTTAVAGETITYTASPDTGWSASAPSSSPSLTMTSAGTNKWTFTMPNSDVTITPNFSKINYSVSVSTTPSGGGTASLSKTTANYQDQITVTTSPATGWKLKSITTSPAATVSSNKFNMPASNTTVTVTFEKITYSVTVNRNPTAGGTASSNKATANYQDTVTLSKTTNSGYYFNGWTSSPAVSINGSGQFSMPNSNVTVTANWLKYSTGTVNTKSLTSGGTVTLTISADKSTYSHKYKLSFGSGMETSLTTVNAGTTSVTISVPDSWASSIPNATQKTGGTLTLETYNGSTKIGTYTISGFTYNVRATALPTLSAISKSIVRTVGGVTYANVGDYYVQNKSAVNVQATASGALGSTISTMTVTLSGYTGAAYGGSVSSNSMNWTSGLLTISGTITITVTATDSRSRTVTATTTFTVTPYSKPSGTLTVWRVNNAGTTDVLGVYAKYTKTSSYTSVGNNTLTVKIKSQGSYATSPANSGDLLPGTGNRQTFSQLSEYSIELEMVDSFETVSIIVKLPTAQFLLAATQDGLRLALMKAVNESLSPGTGKTGVIEFSDTAQIYIGSVTLEQYIRNVINNS